MHRSGKLGFVGLVALVFGLVVGVGIYNLPQNMAVSASAGAVGIAWIITAIGILPLVLAFKWLSEQYSEYNAGIYQYAQAGFGNFAGFNIAWGYWLCTAFSNVTYGVLLNDSVGAFFPQLLQQGLPTVLFCSALIWLMYFIVSRGIQTAKFINTMLSVVKFLMLAFIVVVLIMFFRLRLFEQNLWVDADGISDIFTQVKSSMMITIFCFLGIEGAVMMSARAKRSKDVGRAGVAGFVVALLLYLSVSLLCFGLMRRAELEGLQDPSIAYILRETCGEWAYWFVISGLIVASLGGWVAWTLVVAQVPYEAAKVGILPPFFKKVNSRGMPSAGLIASSMAMEAFLLMVVFADNMYLAALRITGQMIIPGYCFTGLFVIKAARTWKMRFIGSVVVLFCLWMAYAGGVVEMMRTSIFYLLGIIFYYKARKCDISRCEPRTFSRADLVAACAMVAIGVVSLLVN